MYRMIRGVVCRSIYGQHLNGYVSPPPEGRRYDLSNTWHRVDVNIYRKIRKAPFLGGNPMREGPCDA